MKSSFENLVISRSVRWWAVTLPLLVVLVASCGPVRKPPSVTAGPTVAPSSTSKPEPSLTPIPSPTATSQPSLAILLAPPGSDAALGERLRQGLEDSFSQLGMRWEMRPDLEPGKLGEAVRLVILLPPDPGAASLASASPGVQFLAVGIPGLASGPNLSVVGEQGERYDQQGFIAGVIAAMITPDWRVGVISHSDTPAGKAARQGFLNGTVYYCGLCNAYHGPIFDYPQFVELPSTASPAEWQAAADILLSQAVKTIYVFPGIADPGLLDYLASSGISLLGGGSPPEALRLSWVASLQADPLPAILEALPGLLKGEAAGSLPLPVAITEVNPQLFSPGKQALAERIRLDLLQGFIDTGVDPLSGESR